MNTGVFFDIDGTLRDIRTSAIPESAIKAIKCLRESGYKLGVATGRAMNEIFGDIKDIIDWDVYVCLNGQTVYTKDAGKIQDLFFPDTIVEKCLEIAGKTGKPLHLTPYDSMFYLTCEPGKDEAEVYEIFGFPLPEIRPYQGERITGIMVFGNKDSDFKEYCEIPGITYFRGIGKFADIALDGVSKYSGITLAMEHYGLSDYIAFGDSLNDVEMLQNARISVAMGEAEEKIIEIASFQTSKVMDDGVEQACRMLKLY